MDTGLTSPTDRATNAIVGLRRFLATQSPARWATAHAATTLSTFLITKICADAILLSNSTTAPTFAEYSNLIQNTIFGVTALWATVVPIGSHWLARRLGGSSSYQNDVVFGSMLGITVVPLWTVTGVLLLREHWTACATGLPLLGIVSCSPALFVSLHELRGWRALITQLSISAFITSLPYAYGLAGPIAGGLLWERGRVLRSAGVPAVPHRNLAPEENAAVAYRMAGETNPPELRWFLEGTKRPYADFMPGLRVMSIRDKPKLSAPTTAAIAALEEAHRLHAASDLDGASQHYLAVLTFLRHLGEQENHPLYFQLTRMMLVSKAFGPLSKLIADPRMTEAHTKALLNAIREAKQPRVRIAQAIGVEFWMQHKFRLAYINQRLPKSFRPNRTRNHKKDVEDLVRQDISAAWRSIITNDPAPILERNDEIESLLRKESFKSRKKSGACIWDVTLLSLCAYDNVSTIGIPLVPRFAVLAETRMLLLETALRATLDPRTSHHLPEDPFAPGVRLRWRNAAGSRIFYSIGPDGKDQGGEPPVSIADELKTLWEGDVALSIPIVHSRPL